MPCRSLVVALVLVAGCNDTAIVLRIASNRPAGQLDAICVELDAGGANKFGRRYALPSLPLPQTLTVLPGGKPATQSIIYAFGGGIERARDRREIPFRSGSVLHVDVPFDVCQPHPTSGRFTAVAAPTSDAVDAATLVPGVNAANAGDVALALTAGASSRYSVAAQGVSAVVGGAPDAAAANVRALVTADLDGDCRLDVVVVATGAPLSAWRDAGDGSFTALGAFGAADVVAAAAGDVDGDGTTDVVAVGGTAAHLWLNDGAGHFRELAGAFDAAPTDATAVALADLDGDGRADVILGQGSATAAVARVYLNTAGGGHLSFTPAALPPKPARVTAFAVGDLDGDGDLDLVMAQTAGPIRAYLNRGDAFLDDRSFTLLPDQVAATVPSLLLADLDGDCLPELVVPRAGVAPLLWKSAGGGKLAAGGSFDQSMPATGALADDIDGDGDLDVLLYGDMTGLQLQVQP